MFKIHAQIVSTTTPVLASLFINPYKNIVEGADVAIH